VLERIDQVMAIMLPSLREERAASYSPFLPICPRTGVVLQVPITAHDVKAGTISYDDPETKERVTLPVTGGHCKLQWKPDWAMRWFALGIDYEMAGKDLIDSVKLSARSARRSAARRRKASTTNCSSTSRARRYQSRRATASPSTNGCAMRRRNRCRCSCTASRRRPSGCTST
jgi:hypothetical protein